MNLTTATPQSIDTDLATLHKAHSTATRREQAALHLLHGAIGDTRRGRGWVLSDADTESRARARAAERNIASGLAKLDQVRAELADIAQQMEARNAEFQRRGGWSRFFLVQQANGHVHTSMDCGTCNHRGKATQFAWLPELSGQTEADAVAAHGPILCSVCLPSAPLHWTNGHAEAKAAREREQCPGTGTFLDRSKPHRAGYVTGNWGTCPECGGEVTLTSGMKLRSHKASA